MRQSKPTGWSDSDKVIATAPAALRTRDCVGPKLTLQSQRPSRENGPMGWRDVNISGVDEADAIVVEYMTQLRALCSYYGCEPQTLHSSDVATGLTISFRLDGNSSWLDDFTPLLVETAEQIRGRV